MSRYDPATCCRRAAAAAVGTAMLTVPVACSSTSAPPGSTSPTSPATTQSFDVRKFPAGPNESMPDDITMLDNTVYVAFQNGVGPEGQPSGTGVRDAIVQAYTVEGTPGTSWTLAGHIDGLAADPDTHRLIATVTEDAKSSIYAITPGANPPIAHYTYSPQPLPHGGGLGSASFYRGQLLASASGATAPDAPAVYRVTLHDTTADVSPVFADDADALVANMGEEKDQHTTLALVDPGSTGVVPTTSPRFAGNFVLAGRRNQEQVYFDESAQPTERLHVLNLANAVADTVWVQRADEILWVSDADHNDIAAISGPFHTGQVITAVTPPGQPHYLGELDLDSGRIHQLPALSGVVPAGGLMMVAPGR